jgi:hypothetical protein
MYIVISGTMNNHSGMRAAIMCFFALVAACGKFLINYGGFPRSSAVALNQVMVKLCIVAIHKTDVYM